MSTNNETISGSIKTLVKTMMDQVMDKVLVTDPFIADDHHAKKPLYAALVPDEIFKNSHFERRFVTPFGSIWEKLAQVVSESALGYSIVGKEITGTIKKERLRRITAILNNLEHSSNPKKREGPNWDAELNHILKGGGNEIPVTVICDIYVEDIKKGKKYAFEIKAPLPNSDQTKVSKEKLLKLYSMTNPKIDEAFFALPYNPYGDRENYSWSFPKRWFDMKKDKVVLIGDEFWNKIGGKGTYQLFISEINKLGKEYKERIYREFLQIEPPEGFDKIKL
jgi:hypothetical protein